MTTSPLLLFFIIFILFLISSRRCPPLKAHPPPRLSLLPMGCCGGKWSSSNLFSIKHQEEAMVVEEELQLRWQRGREGWWRKQWTRPHFNESAPRFREGKQEARMLNCHRRVMCKAAKKSLKEKKLHIGPWKKSGFMQLKWSGFNQTLSLANSMGDIPANEPYLRISGAPTVLVT